MKTAAELSLRVRDLIARNRGNVIWDILALLDEVDLEFEKASYDAAAAADAQQLQPTRKETPEVTDPLPRWDDLEEDGEEISVYDPRSEIYTIGMKADPEEHV